MSSATFGHHQQPYHSSPPPPYGSRGHPPPPPPQQNGAYSDWTDRGASRYHQQQQGYHQHAPPPPSFYGYHPNTPSAHHHAYPSLPPHSQPPPSSGYATPGHYGQFAYPAPYPPPGASAGSGGGCRKHPQSLQQRSNQIEMVDLTSEEDLQTTVESDCDSLANPGKAHTKANLITSDDERGASQSKKRAVILSDSSDASSDGWISKPKCHVHPSKQKRRAVIESDDSDTASTPAAPAAAAIHRDFRPKPKKQVSGTVGDQLERMRHRREEAEDEDAGARGRRRAMGGGGSPSVVHLADDDDEDDLTPLTKTKENGENRSPPSSSGSSASSREPTPTLKMTPKARKQTKAQLKGQILEEFNTAAEADLAVLPRCSAKMAAVIVSLRPFTDYNQLYMVMKDTKGASVAVLDQYLDQLADRGCLEQILTGCEQRANRLTYAAEMLHADRLRLKRKPRLIPDEHELKIYQLVGLNWLVLMHGESMNSILADEMGLGKTIQIIAFLAYLKQVGEKGPHLIVVPASTLDNWMLELKKWCPALEVQAYYGSQEDRKYIRNDLSDRERRCDIDVLLTTYSMIGSSPDDRAFFKSFRIHYVIYDEAHMLKNCTTSRYQRLMKLRAKRKILLTGTPLQNNLIELISLMYFVMSEMFNTYLEDLSQVMAQFKNNAGMASAYEEQKIAKAKQIMMPFVLRRLKADVLRELPGKSEQVHSCTMTPTQIEVYTGLVAAYKAEAERYAAERAEAGKDGEVAGSRQRSHQLMQLRKAANHPLLHRRRFTNDMIDKIVTVLTKANEELSALVVREQLLLSSDYEISDTMEKYPDVVGYALPDDAILDSGKFQKLDTLLPALKQQGQKVLIFSQLVMVLDIMERYMSIRNHSYLRLDGQTPVIDRQDLIQEFNGDAGIFCFLLSTRAGGLGINLTSANVIILHDIDFNPYNDRQAEDRCHRMGQTKEVTVIKLISKDTVEEKMLECARNKLKLEKDVTGKDREGGNTTEADQPDDNLTIERLLNEAMSEPLPLPAS